MLMEASKAIVLRYLDDHCDELLEFTRNLIATPSMNPPGDERAIERA